MESILLSIKPEYVKRIFGGSKQFEFRKRLADKIVQRIYIYETAPTMQVVGEAQILGVLSDAPTALWEKTKEKAGISRDKFREYFKGCKTAYAYKLGEVTKYELPKELIEFNTKQPPQSFVYISDVLC